ncbi:hypothetical protein [Roseivirga thermotolerans]|uniref:hypothetical protein n=1 Tax=Roseivirga thermotolerans TaxID=1758176 RepID=UPI00273D2496|nr:hypothetical protein [Roseivirga thermotolerans]
MEQYNGQYYSFEPGLNGGEWIGSGINLVSNLIGGNQSKKQSERELEALRLQQQIAQENNAAALEAERLRLQSAQLQASTPLAPSGQGGMSNGLKAVLIVSTVGIAAVGTALLVKANSNGDKPLNGLVHTLE